MAGKIITIGEYNKIISLLEGYPKLSIVMDEVYRELIYNGLEHVDFSALIDRTYIIGSFSKTFPIQGARIGWVVTNSEKQKALEPLFQNTYGSVSSYGQELAKKIIREKLSYYQLYDNSRIKIINELNKRGLEYLVPEGTFYIFLKVGMDDQTFQKLLLVDNVKVLSGSLFGKRGKGYIRISFAQDFSIIQSSLDIIVDVLNSQLKRVKNEGC